MSCSQTLRLPRGTGSLSRLLLRCRRGTPTAPTSRASAPRAPDPGAAVPPCRRAAVRPCRDRKWSGGAVASRLPPFALASGPSPLATGLRPRRRLRTGWREAGPITPSHHAPRRRRAPARTRRGGLPLCINRPPPLVVPPRGRPARRPPSSPQHHLMRIDAATLSSPAHTRLQPAGIAAEPSREDPAALAVDGFDRKPVRSSRMASSTTGAAGGVAAAQLRRVVRHLTDPTSVGLLMPDGSARAALRQTETIHALAALGLRHRDFLDTVASTDPQFRQPSRLCPSPPSSRAGSSTASPWPFHVKHRRIAVIATGLGVAATDHDVGARETGPTVSTAPASCTGRLSDARCEARACAPDNSASRRRRVVTL